VATGGTDLSTGLPFVGVLKAPVGSTVVTPLTTLVAELVKKGADIAEAQSSVLKATGLSALDGQVDLSNFDPVAAAKGSDAAAQAAALQVQKAAVVLMTLVSKLTDQVREDAGANEGSRDEIASAIFSQLVNQISASPEALEGSLTAASINSTATALVTKLSQEAELGGVTVDGDKLLKAKTAITESVSGLAQQLETVNSIDDLGAAQKETLTSTTYTLQLLHFADAEAGMLASQTAPRLAALVDRFEDDFVNSITLAGRATSIRAMATRKPKGMTLKSLAGNISTPKTRKTAISVIVLKGSNVCCNE
jgi:adenine-specific DNA methylase